MQLTQFALKKLDLIVDEFWAEISDSIQTIEVLKDIFSILVYTSHQVVSEDDLYPAEVRQQAALVASKVGNSSTLVCLTSKWMFRCTTTLAHTKIPCNMLWVLPLSSTSPTLVASECFI